MAVERVENVTLAKIPDFDCRVRACAEQIATIWVESNIIHDIGGSIIVLNRLLAPYVEDFDDCVSTTRRNTGTVWMEFDRADTLAMIVEDANV